MHYSKWPHPPNFWITDTGFEELWTDKIKEAINNNYSNVKFPLSTSVNNDTNKGCKALDQDPNYDLISFDLSGGGIPEIGSSYWTTLEDTTSTSQISRPVTLTLRNNIKRRYKNRNISPTVTKLLLSLLILLPMTAAVDGHLPITSVNTKMKGGYGTNVKKSQNNDRDKDLADLDPEIWIPHDEISNNQKNEFLCIKSAPTDTEKEILVANTSNETDDLDFYDKIIHRDKKELKIDKIETGIGLITIISYNHVPLIWAMLPNQSC